MGSSHRSILLFFLLPYVQLQIINSLSSSSNKLCHNNEMAALLEFKQGFSLDKLVSFEPFAHPKMASWKPEGEQSKDCCSWDGVECNKDTGHIIGLDLGSSFLYGSINSSSSLFKLVHLRRLNLADNHFNYSQIPSGISRLSNLSFLNLSSSFFYGQIPLELIGLSKLAVLDLAENVDNHFPFQGLLKLKTPNLRTLVQKLASLEELYLSTVHINSTEWLWHERNQTIGLPWAGLRIIDLSHNMLEGSVPSPPPNSLYYKVSNNKFTGEIPHSICRVSTLVMVDLSNNGLSGRIPSCLGHFSNYLSILNLRGNNFQGTIPQIYSQESNLRMIDLSQNRLEGMVPRSLGNCRMLQELNLEKIR